MRLLVVTNTYPSAAFPSDGIFVKRQVDALVSARVGIDAEICFVDTIRGKYRYLAGAAQVWRAASRFKPDLLHIHYGLSQLLCWPILRTPRVVTFHGSDLTIGWQQRIGLALLGSHTHAVVVADGLKHLLGPGRSASTVPCGVQCERFRLSRSVAREKLAIPPEELLVLFGANPARPVKRYDRFEAAVEYLRRLHPQLRTARLSDVDVGDVPTLIAGADVLLLTSDREGSPVVTKEALCAGVRVVSTPVGDVSDQLQGFSGCRVATTDPATLASSVSAALLEPPPDRVQAAGRFDIQNEVASLVRIYQKLLAA